MNLRVPGYQRPYRWGTKNVAELLGDIDHAMAEAEAEADKYDGFKYRIGSVILHHNVEDDCYDLVDGQQRMLSLVLIALCLGIGEDYPLLKNSSFSNRETQANLKANYELIRDWMGYQPAGWREQAKEAFSKTLEAVVIIVDRIDEAFQLFDSQNTRGRSLDPHDLLKAYHLRAMRDNRYEMRHVVTRWEEFSAKEVRDVFAEYLFPILNWERGDKTRNFTAREIDAYKGIDAKRGYTYAVRAMRAAPSFQIDEPFMEGEDFFLMAEHYLALCKDIELELENNDELKPLGKRLNKKDASSGYKYACQLFRCALLAYYDRFHTFDTRSVRKLFTWALMIRVDMTTLGQDSINKYAVGEENDRYTNVLPMFKRIARARYHTDIANEDVRARPAPEGANEERQKLAKFLVELSKGDVR